jgi:methyltransferase (TIGR00027 family)
MFASSKDKEVMSDPEPLIRNISDTARWAAVYRARETERPDAVFRDPFARRLAGERGEQIANALPEGNRTDWAWVTRTYLFDQLIREEVRRGADMVINLAAGLDARPYRMELPASLRWVEVDLPEILTYKEGILAAEKPVCVLERVRLNLADGNGRRELFARLGKQACKALVITEGLLVYLTAEEVGALARDLAAEQTFAHWITDLLSPGLLQMLKKNWSPQLSQAGAPLKFGPEEGPEFFTSHGWKPADVRSTLKTASHLKRLPWWLRLIALLPDSKGRQGSRPWSAALLLARQ